MYLQDKIMNERKPDIQRNWAALKKIAGVHFEQFHEKYPEWTSEDLIRHLDQVLLPQLVMGAE